MVLRGAWLFTLCCSTSLPEAPEKEPAASPAPAAPVVKLLDPGAEPRRGRRDRSRSSG